MRTLRIYVQDIQFIGCLALNIKRRGGNKIKLRDAFVLCGDLDKNLNKKHDATLDTLSREGLLDIAYTYNYLFTVSEDDEIININDNATYQDIEDHLCGTLPSDIINEMNKAFDKIQLFRNE